MNIDDELSVLKSLNDDDNAEAIAGAIRSLSSFNSMIVTLDKHLYVWRARLEQSLFEIKNSSEVSFNPNIDGIKRGRANKEKESVFYACFAPTAKSVDIQASSDSILGAGQESSKQFKSKILFDEFGYISRWRLIDEIKVTAFINYPFSGEHKRISDFRDDFEVMNEQISTTPERDWEINNWIAEKFARDYPTAYKNAYHITSMIASNGYRQNEGIMFPSVRMTGKVLVVAIHNSSCHKLQMDKIIKVKRNIEGSFIVQGESDTVQDNGEITWIEGYRPRPLLGMRY